MCACVIKPGLQTAAGAAVVMAIAVKISSKLPKKNLCSPARTVLIDHIWETCRFFFLFDILNLCLVSHP